MHWQILIALLAAVAVAAYIKQNNSASNQWVIFLSGSCDFVAKLFMNALKMVVVPLTLSSIICGVMKLGSERDFGRMGTKTVLYYVFSSLIAILVGLICVNWIQPGIVDPELAKSILGHGHLPKGILSQTPSLSHGAVSDMLLRIVPSNIISAATDNSQLLGIIFFGVLFGFFINRLSGSAQEMQRDLWRGIQQIMLQITGFVIRFVPLGVFGLVFPVILRTGSELLKPVFVFMLTVFAGLVIYFIVVLWCILRFLARVRPGDHYKAMIPVLLTAFSTSSSSSTLPVAMEAVENTAGVSNKIASFTLPIGATLNMSGTALYECVVVIFIAQLCSVVQGTVFGIGDQLIVVALSLLTSMGTVGIPAAALVSVTIILGAFGLPLEAVGVIWVVERILDMTRTVVNVFSDTCGAIVIARSEGEKTNYTVL